MNTKMRMRDCSLFIFGIMFFGTTACGQQMEHLQVSADGTHFVYSGTEQQFTAWGVNYDHDSSGRLLDEYWIDDWESVVEDFREIKELGANCVRIHLQLGKFMDSPNEVSPEAIAQLKRLVGLAEELKLYLDVTGLACYHKANIPDWYDKLSESARWNVQARFWNAVATACADSPAIFCYDLMNEPILPGKEPSTEWVGGELGGKFFVQRLALELHGRSRKEIAKQWVNQMVDAIREADDQHMVTVGVIPWVFAFGGGKPLFHSPEVGERLDFVAVHFYPKEGEVDKALKALQAYETGKPLVVEEMFPLKCSTQELKDFVKRSSTHADGWFSFYWGKTAEQLRSKEKPSIGETITADWLDEFKKMSAEMTHQE